MLQSKPQCFCAWWAIRFSPEKTTEACDHINSLPKCRWVIGRDWILILIGYQSFPLSFFKKDSAWNIRGFSTKFGQMKNPPGNNHINSKTSLYAVGFTKLSLFDFTSAFECFMIHLNSPAKGIPIKFFNCIFEGIDLERCQKQPLQRFSLIGAVNFFCYYCLYLELSQMRSSFGWFQSNLCKTDFQFGFSRRRSSSGSPLRGAGKPSGSCPGSARPPRA